MPKYSWEDPIKSTRFPASDGWRNGYEEIGYSDLYDSQGKQIGPYIVAFDSDTGEIWEKIGDDDGNGQTLLKASKHPAPLAWVPLTDRRGTNVRIVDVDIDECWTVPEIYDESKGQS
jgi:hypothetical protein